MRLPSFSNLIAFDAVARHGTLTSAAGELNVSQPAVSRRIAMLEADMGCQLFDRTTKPLRLTINGNKLFDVLRSGLSRLEVAVAQIRSESVGDTVSISAASGMAAFWIIPRLPRLQAQFPKISIRIISQTHREAGDESDLHIRFGDGVWPETDSVKILGEDVYPVCSPLFLDGQEPPLNLEEMKAMQLLSLDSDSRQWHDWNTWFDAAGAPVNHRLRTIDFDSYALVVSAALAGQGICLCWSGLLDQFLDTGALVRLSEVSVSSSRGYFLMLPSDLSAGSPIPAIAEWLRANSQVSDL